MKKVILFASLLLISSGHNVTAMSDTPLESNSFPAYCNKIDISSPDVRDGVKLFSETAIINLADITGFSKNKKIYKLDSSHVPNWNSVETNAPPLQSW